MPFRPGRLFARVPSRLTCSARPARPATARLGLEGCEDRTVPASIAFDPATGVLRIDADSNTDDFVQITPAGASSTGSTGVRVLSSIDGYQNRVFGDTAPIGQIQINGQNGNDNVQVASLDVVVLIGEGNGNNFVRVGNTRGTAVIAGSGRNNVQLGGGTDNGAFTNFFPGVTTGVAVFLGYDYVFGDPLGIFVNGEVGNNRDNYVSVGTAAGQSASVDILGNGTNNVSGGAGTDYVRVIGNGNNYVNAGTGANFLFVQGSGNNNLTGLGTGSITIDGGGNNHVNAGTNAGNAVTLTNAVGFSYIAAANAAAVTVNGATAGGTGFAGPAYVQRV